MAGGRLMERSNREYIIGETKGRDAVVDYNAPQPGESHEAKAMQVEFYIAKKIGEDLCRTYQNRQWHVDVDSRNGVIVIACPSLSKRLGYRLHLKRDTIAELIPRCRRAAGEILERFGVSRSKIIDPASLETFERDVHDDVKAQNAVDTFASKL
jgi:hypothetical protein